MNLQEATKRANEIRALYAELEQKLYGRAWNTQEIMLGFVGDIGDLSKLIQGAEGVRTFPDLDKKLSHELADCLWSLLVLSDRLGIDIEEAFDSTMLNLENVIREKLDT
jgi:NTP pyrophosphatase (non-canonical NTP hydrolase)